jgi:hypothetical protein
MTRIFVIPDTQVRPGVDTSHIDWAAQAIVDYKPDYVLHLGDHWDFPSCSRHNEPGSLEGEGQRFKEDVDVGNEAFARLCAPMEKEQARLREGHRKRWEPQKHYFKGNHCVRPDLVAKREPKWQGVIGSHLCDTRDWNCHEFLEIVDICGFAVSHYFANTHSGRPIGGSIESRLNAVGRSNIQGHEQGLRHGRKPYPGNLSRLCIVAGSFYLHTENYRGPQGRDEWRGCVVINEAENGDGDIMPLSMKYLRRKYG